MYLTIIMGLRGRIDAASISEGHAVARLPITHLNRPQLRVRPPTYRRPYDMPRQDRLFPQSRDRRARRAQRHGSTRILTCRPGLLSAAYAVDADAAGDRRGNIDVPLCQVVQRLRESLWRVAEHELHVQFLAKNGSSTVPRNPIPIIVRRTGQSTPSLALLRRYRRPITRSNPAARPAGIAHKHGY
jgi:hypothetical protein